MKPFTDHNRFEQGMRDDPFYASGSYASVGEEPGTFSTSLFGKDQIKLSFKVTNKCQMLPNSSSIYYFNIADGTWNIPNNSVLDHVGPFDKFSYCTAWNPPSGTFGLKATAGSIFIEDAKGFDAYGRNLCSGSLDIFRQTDWSFPKNQSIEIIGNGFDSAKDIFPYLVEDYKNSVQRSNLYDAESNQTFELDIQESFLIEKVVFEIPFSMGQTWFQDMTTTCLSYGKGLYGKEHPTEMPPTFYYDKGGPALTLSLFCQKDYGDQKIRDLILSSLITHADDSSGIVKARLFDMPVTEGGINPLILLETYGLKNPSAVVEKNIYSQFTGSVVVKSKASISNGASGFVSTAGVIFNNGIVNISPPPLPPEQWKEFLNLTLNKFLSSCQETFSKKFVVSNNIGPGYKFAKGNLLGSSNYFTLGSIDPFGRGMTGFSQSGGSVFGREYYTPQIDMDGTSLIDNPYFINSNEKIVDVVSNISSTFDNVFKTFPYSHPPTPGYEVTYVLNISDGNLFSGEKDSPYLVNPGDRLVLALSKTRPAISGSRHIVPDSLSADKGFQEMIDFSNLIGDKSGHDVCLLTGSINITFYGSYIREGSRYRP